MHIFVDSITGEEIIINGADVAHLQVRRQKAGQFFKIIETSGNSYVDAELILLSKNQATFKVKTVFEKKQSKTKITLFQSVIKKSNMELVVQKAVELGVDSVVPVMTERVSELGAINYTRLALIAKEAAMQSERYSVPSIEKAISFSEAIVIPNIFCLGERVKGNGILEFMNKIVPSDNLGVLVGPEGGFSGRELSFLQEKMVPVVSFGESIMRAETAAIAALSVIRSFYLAE